MAKASLHPSQALARLGAWARGFPRAVWLLTAATVIESTGRFMIVPYLSLYLDRSGVSLGVIGLILGAAPFASVIFGAIGGQLSDRWGRKPVQILGVVLSGIALFGFSLAGPRPVLLGILNFLNGMTRTFYRPATSAALADLCPPNRRSEAFALNRTALNAAFGWGPLLGVFIFEAAPRLGFAIGGALNLAVGVFLALAVPESAPAVLARREESRRGASAEAREAAAVVANDARNDAPGAAAAGSSGEPSGLAAWKAVFADRGFLVWLLGLMAIWGAYDLIQSFLPLHLQHQGLAVGAYGAILAANAAVCVLGQIPASRLLRSAPIGPVAALSRLPFVLGFLGFAWLHSPALLILAMVILTLGEVTGAAVQVLFIPERAPPALLGRYLGLSVAQDLGKVFVAPAAGFIMAATGGEAVFIGAAVLSLAGGALLYAATRMEKPRA